MAGAFGLPEISPQIQALSYGGAMPSLDRGLYVEQQAEFLPQLRAQERQEEMFEEQMRLNREARRDARTDANTALGMKGATLGYQAYNSPTVRKYGKAVLDALRPKPVAAPALVPSYAQEGVAATVPSYAAEPAVAAAAPATSAVAGATESLAPTLAAPASTGFSGVLPSIGGEGLAASAGRMAVGALPGLTGTATGALVEDSNFGEFMHKRGVMGEKEADVTGGALGGALTGFLLGGPAGAVAGGLGGMAKAACVIVTACHGADSEEVAITREYRDMFMSKPQLRAYYAMSEKLVPILEQNEDVREYVKETLVAPLIKFGSWRLGKTNEHPTPREIAVAKNFLIYLSDVGSTMHEPFVRSNGEVI
jgi:hypothetical protein